MSEDEVLRETQRISWPPIPRFSVRVKVVDKIYEGRRQGTSLVNIKQVCDVRLEPRIVSGSGGPGDRYGLLRTEPKRGMDFVVLLTRVRM